MPGIDEPQERRCGATLTGDPAGLGPDGLLPAGSSSRLFLHGAGRGFRTARPA
jgi:hypothetical protein